MRIAIVLRVIWFTWMNFCCLFCCCVGIVCGECAYSSKRNMKPNMFVVSLESINKMTQKNSIANQFRFNFKANSFVSFEQKSLTLQNWTRLVNVKQIINRIEWRNITQTLRHERRKTKSRWTNEKKNSSLLKHKVQLQRNDWNKWTSAKNSSVQTRC